MTFSAKDYSNWKKIGKGSTGTVFSVAHRSFNKVLAVKKIPLQFPADTPIIACLELEARSIMDLDHDNIIHLHDFGLDGDCYYLSMDYVDGGSFEQLFSLRPFPKEILLLMAFQMLKGLLSAHQKNSCHGNLKPTNILFSKSGNVVLTDFGNGISLAHAFNNAVVNHAEACPVYLAPEQAAYLLEQLQVRSAAIERSSKPAIVKNAAVFQENDDADVPVFSDRKHTNTFPLPADDVPVFSDVKIAPVSRNATAADRPAMNDVKPVLRSGGQDVRKDLWSVGVILHRILTGTLPFNGINPATALPSAGPQRARPILSSDPTLPDDLATAIDACLSIEPGKRPVSLGPIVLALQKFIEDFGFVKSEDTVRSFLNDATATYAILEKKATDYHIRKGNELLASGDSSKANAHFEAAKEIVFDPSKNDRPISFTAESIKENELPKRKGKEIPSSGNATNSGTFLDAPKNATVGPSKNDRPNAMTLEPSDDPFIEHAAAPFSGMSTGMVTAVKKIITGKVFITVALVVAVIMVTVVVMTFAVSTIRQSLRKSAASSADVLQIPSPVKDRPSSLPDQGGTAGDPKINQVVPAAGLHGGPEKDTSTGITPGSPVGDRVLLKSNQAVPAAGSHGGSRKDTPIGKAPAIPAAGDGSTERSTRTSPRNSGGNPILPSGVLFATVEPPFADLFLDGAGVPIEELTAGKKLQPGSHTISAIANGYQSYKNEIQIEKDTLLKLAVVMKKEAVANGSLHVFSYPWAELYIDGTFKGSTPTPNIILLSEGDHTLRLQHKGFKTHIENVFIKAGEEKRLQIEMEKE
jgi:serine/threonine protein kinase